MFLRGMFSEEFFFYFLTTQKLFLLVPKKVKTIILTEGECGGEGLTNVKCLFEGFPKSNHISVFCFYAMRQ